MTQTETQTKTKKLFIVLAIIFGLIYLFTPPHISSSFGNYWHLFSGLILICVLLHYIDNAPLMEFDDREEYEHFSFYQPVEPAAAAEPTEKEKSEIIKYFFKGQELGLAILPSKTFAAERRQIAKDIGIKQYDRIQFIAKDGSIRADSDKVGPTQIFQEEFKPID